MKEMNKHLLMIAVNGLMSDSSPIRLWCISNDYFISRSECLAMPNMPFNVDPLRHACIMF